MIQLLHNFQSEKRLLPLRSVDIQFVKVSHFIGLRENGKY